MNAFQKHGIKHLSASSLALYRNQPSLFVLQYLYGIKGDVGPSAWRGSAVEAGVDWAVMRLDDPIDVAVAKAYERFDLDAQGETSNEIEHERASLSLMVAQAVMIMRPLGMPTARQFKIEHWLDGIEVPVIGYIDYLYETSLVDLKTTNRMPSEVRPDHAVQVAIYSEATGKKPFLAYATPKKSWLAPITAEQYEQSLWTVTQSARAVRALLSSVESKEQAAALFVPDFGSFYWSEGLIREALTVWR
jgi:hypothetical protein